MAGFSWLQAPATLNDERLELNPTSAQPPPRMELDYSNASGDVEADFASGDFNIACPGVSFAVLNNVLNNLPLA
jgi:hypothetical protein